MNRFVSTAPNQMHELSGDVVLTMWESTRLRPEWVANLNRARAILVPCRWCFDLFEASGVTVPMRIVPLGYYPEVFHPTIPEPEGVTVFGCAGRTSHGGSRKGLREVALAFLDAFPTEPDVRLEIKIWPDCKLETPDDPRIVVNREPLSDEGLADWYRSLSVFVSASKSEGWGMQPHQAMACGRPTIACLYGGHLEYMTPKTSYPVAYHEEAIPEDFPVYGGLGRWSIPHHDSIVARMREAYGNPSKRRAKGKAAARRARHFTWARAGERLVGALREFELLPPGDPRKPPGLMEMASNFIVAAATQVAHGNPIASPETQAERKAICEACPSLVNGGCVKCGCGLMDWKRSWATSFCPDGKW